MVISEVDLGSLIETGEFSILDAPKNPKPITPQSNENYNLVDTKLPDPLDWLPKEYLKKA